MSKEDDRPDVEYKKGIIHPQNPRYDMARVPPPRALRPFVEFFWQVKWSLADGEDFQVESLPNPCVHLVFEGDQCWLEGPKTRRFTRGLISRGETFGVKFWPYGFYAFWRSPVSALLNQRVTNSPFLETIRSRVSSAELFRLNLDERIAVMVDILVAAEPNCDADMRLVRDVLETIRHERHLYSVDAFCEKVGQTKRTLQRILKKVVGVHPKWILQLHRFQEIAEFLDSGATVDFAGVALDMGFADQAHLIKQFKAVTGRTPRQYLEEGRKDR